MTKKNKKYRQPTFDKVFEKEKAPVFEANTGEVEFSTETTQNQAEDVFEQQNQDVEFEVDNNDINDQAMEFDFYKQQLEAQQANAQMYMHMAQQLQADFDNYRKRNANLAKESKKEGIVEAVCAMLPAYDALVEGLRMIKDENTKKGLQMVERAFVQSLADLEIYPIESLDKQFDPKFHNVIMSEEQQGIESGTIVQEFSKGFVDKDGNVVRVATVKTAK